MTRQPAHGVAMVPSAALSNREPRTRRWRRVGLGVAPALGIFLVALWELWASTRAGHDVPDDRAWAAAAALVRAEHQPGDLIGFAPAWIDPVGRKHLGDLIPVAMAARMDDARYATLWELSIRGADAPEAQGRRVEWVREVAGVRVRRLVREPAVVLTDFVTALPRAAIAGPAAQRPAIKLEEVGFAPHRCVRVEPRPDSTVRIVYRNVQLGTVLVGYVGLADVFTRRDIRDPGRLEVAIDDRPVARVQFGVDDGWVRFVAETSPHQRATVAFAATAVGPRARQRLICFAAEARQ